METNLPGPTWATLKNASTPPIPTANGFNITPSRYTTADPNPDHMRFPTSELPRDPGAGRAALLYGRRHSGHANRAKSALALGTSRSWQDNLHSTNLIAALQTRHLHQRISAGTSGAQFLPIFLSKNRIRVAR